MLSSVHGKTKARDPSFKPQGLWASSTSSSYLPPKSMKSQADNLQTSSCNPNCNTREMLCPALKSVTETGNTNAQQLSAHCVHCPARAPSAEHHGSAHHCTNACQVHAVSNLGLNQLDSSAQLSTTRSSSQATQAHSAEFETLSTSKHGFPKPSQSLDWWASRGGEPNPCHLSADRCKKSSNPKHPPSSHNRMQR